jgi:hypothetical protein
MSEIFSGNTKPNLVDKSTLEEILKVGEPGTNPAADPQYIAVAIFSSLATFYTNFIKPNMFLVLFFVGVALYFLLRDVVREEQLKDEILNMDVPQETPEDNNATQTVKIHGDDHIPNIDDAFEYGDIDKEELTYSLS